MTRAPEYRAPLSPIIRETWNLREYSASTLRTKLKIESIGALAYTRETIPLHLGTAWRVNRDVTRNGNPEFLPPRVQGEEPKQLTEPTENSGFLLFLGNFSATATRHRALFTLSV